MALSAGRWKTLISVYEKNRGRLNGVVVALVQSWPARSPDINGRALKHFFLVMRSFEPEKEGLF